MKSIGAPDWTDRIYQEHGRYKNVRYMDAWGAVPVLPAWKTIINYNGVGCFGYLWGISDDPYMYTHVTLDDVVIYYMHAANLQYLGLWGYQSAWGKMGVTKWDAVNDYYAFFYDERWDLYFKKNFTVKLAYDLGHAGNGAVNVWYKTL